ncbi:hypothetical protein Tco_0369971 [Tanacetum coccineum]
MPTEPFGIADSPSLDANLAPTDSETESDEEVLGINVGDQDEGQAGPNLGVQDEGQAGPNSGVQDEGQTGSNPGDAAESQPQSSHVENLKLPIKDQVILEDPTSSTGTLSSLQNLDKELSFTNQFLEEKPHEDELKKTNTKSEVSKAVDVIVTDAIDWAMQALLRACFSDLPAVDIKEVLQQRMFKDKSYLAYEDHKNLFEALEKSLERDYLNQLLSNLEEARMKKRKKHASPRTLSGSPPSQPPPPPPPAGASDALALEKSLECDHSNQLLSDLEEARRKKRKKRTSGASGSSQFPLPPPPLSTGTS